MNNYATGEQKSQLRGVFHQFFLLFIPPYAFFLLRYSDTLEKIIANCVFVSCVFFCYLVSALYHRVSWSLKAENIIRRLDHIAIYFVNAGSYTPVSVLVLDRTYGIVVLSLAWGSTAIGVFYCLFKTMRERESNIGLFLYFLVGSSLLPFVWQVYERLPLEIFILVPLTWAFTFSGLMVYSYRLFDFFPSIFGYHEVFHLLIIFGQISTMIANFYITL